MARHQIDRSKVITVIGNFISSGCVDLAMWLKILSSDINLKGYLCIPFKETQNLIERLKQINDPSDVYQYLVENQIFVNRDEETYDKAIPLIYQDVLPFIKYYGFIMCNNDDTAEGWQAEFTKKFYYFVNFYRNVWFHPEKLNKPSKASTGPKLYKEIMFMAKGSISGERNDRARKAALNPESSIFKTSIYGDDGEIKPSIEAKCANTKEVDETEDNIDGNNLISRVINEAGRYYNGAYVNHVKGLLLEKVVCPSCGSLEVEQTNTCAQVPYECQECGKMFAKPTTPLTAKKLTKVLLYKNGLISPKVLIFIKNMSHKEKQHFNISPHLLEARLVEYNVVPKTYTKKVVVSRVVVK